MKRLFELVGYSTLAALALSCLWLIATTENLR